ncbi:MAG: Amidohydrolase [Subtercola sp.]|nr:Amidohydrolase [Subtercola sp.]
MTDAKPSAGYSGPVIDTFLHTPWLGRDDPADPRGDSVDWQGDTRLQRVMRTFSHTTTDGSPAPMLDVGQILAEMDASGVTRALLPAKVYYPSSDRGVRAVHRQLAELASASGGRLKTVATIAPPQLGSGTYWDFMQGVRTVKHAKAEYDVVGVHITPSPWGMGPDHKWFYPVYAACAELDLTLFVHVGMPGPLWPMSLQNPELLDEVALAFPDLRIVAHHIGDPWTDISVRLAARHPNFYICTSAWSPKRYPQELLEFMASSWHSTPGASKVIFASDYPLMDMTRTVRDARMLPLTAQQLGQIMHDTAERLFWGEGK